MSLSCLLREFTRNNAVVMYSELVVTQGLQHEVAGREKSGWQLDWGDASTLGEVSAVLSVSLICEICWVVI